MGVAGGMFAALWAFEATIAAITASNFWNPIGWVLGVVAIIIIVVLAIWSIIEYWDEIVAFGAAVWSASVETATEVWDATVEGLDWAEEKIKTILEAAAVTTATLLGAFNVYDIHVLIPDDYNDYIRGRGSIPINLSSGAIYKYGITSYTSVLKRYSQFSWVSPKEEMIYLNLSNGTFGAREWYAFRKSYPVARTIESTLILNYVLGYYKFPPGNTGMY